MLQIPRTSECPKEIHDSPFQPSFLSPSALPQQVGVSSSKPETWGEAAIPPSSSQPRPHIQPVGKCCQSDLRSTHTTHHASQSPRMVPSYRRLPPGLSVSATSNSSSALPGSPLRISAASTGSVTSPHPKDKILRPSALSTCLHHVSLCLCLGCSSSWNVLSF